MRDETIGAALEREHREIDAGIAEFAASMAAGAADTAPLLRAASALRRHIYLEEEHLFPALRAAGLVAPVFVMLREHGAIWNCLDALENSLADGADSPSATKIREELVALLDAHNSKEEPILYPQADQVLTGEAALRFREYLDTGTTPDGWVCERAGA